MSANPYNEAPFRQVSNMETPLATAVDLLAGIAFIAETLDPDEAGPIQRIAGLAGSAVREAEELRGQLFRLTHPRRDHFEKEGWPGDEKPLRMVGGERNG